VRRRVEPDRRVGARHDIRGKGAAETHADVGAGAAFDAGDAHAQPPADVGIANGRSSNSPGFAFRMTKSVGPYGTFPNEFTTCTR
jgi:hypothetical protein